jgi:hypothetical protein
VRGPGDPPLVGRMVELGLVAASRAAGGVGFVLLGPSGVGKTRLARAALDEAERSGAAPLWVPATSSASAVPFGALAGVLPGYIGSEDPLTLLRTSAQALAERAGRRQLVLGVDDAQRLDQSSAALVLPSGSPRSTPAPGGPSSCWPSASRCICQSSRGSSPTSRS